MLLYGADLRGALNEMRLAENGVSIFGRQISVGYYGRGFVWKESPLCRCARRSREPHHLTHLRFCDVWKQN